MTTKAWIEHPLYGLMLREVGGNDVSILDLLLHPYLERLNTSQHKVAFMGTWTCSVRIGKELELLVELCIAAC